MADFQQAFSLTIGHEIGYSDHEDDAGGETYNGIARRYHASWAGWLIVDKAKDSPDFPQNIPEKRLEAPVEAFYRRIFWRKIKGDQVGSQDLANFMFDIAVNGGVRRSVSYLQKVLNLLNREGRDYDDLAVDGRIGAKTFAALNKYLIKRDINALLLYYAARMLVHWMDRAEKIPDQESFLNGIGNRWVGNFKHVADKFYV